MDFFEIGSYSGGVWAKSQGQICDEDPLWQRQTIIRLSNQLFGRHISGTWTIMGHSSLCY